MFRAYIGVPTAIMTTVPGIFMARFMRRTNVDISCRRAGKDLDSIESTFIECVRLCGARARVCVCVCV